MTGSFLISQENTSCEIRKNYLNSSNRIKVHLIDRMHTQMKKLNTDKERKKEMTLYEELQARGLIAQVTDEALIKEQINNGKATFYIGFDPTADSLHVGHFMALCLMKRLQMAGNKPIALLGGGTGMIGDPSGRSDMRQMMTVEMIQHNCDRFKEQMSKFIDFSEGKALMVNNADWLMDLNYIEVLREVGPHFSVNRMLSAECYKQRMEKGLTFLEFNYMIMQAYDFYALYQRYGCSLQFGGDDQWGNMLAGTELIRRKLGKDASALTITLLLNSEGKKMGKTQSGAVWLDPNKTSPFDFYQYWRNIADADVLKCIRMLTFLPLEEIDAMDAWEGSQLNKAKEILAYELTKMVHSEEEAQKAQTSAKALFSQGNAAEMPTTELNAEDFGEDKIDILTLLLKTGLVASKSEARRAVEQGGVSADGVKTADIHVTFARDAFAGDGMVLKKGKKSFRKVVLK
jgi:tyrosyl-tRNA synthetase